MPNELTNLLPEERQRVIARDYYLRLATLTALIASFLMIGAGVLLVPSYVLLTSSASSKQARLATIEASLASSHEKEISAQLALLAQNAKTLTALAENTSVTAVLRAALAVSRPGIRLTRLAYAPEKGKTAPSLTLSGVAATRDALRNYQIALQGAPFAASAMLPVSAYAKDADIDFTITVSLKP